MENRKKSIEELQAELTLEAEALGTLQLIYAEKVKQVRVNTLLPPDIQARFLNEWETFYQQRMTALFRKDYLLEPPSQGTKGRSAINKIPTMPVMPPMPSPLAVPAAPLQPAQATVLSAPAPTTPTPIAPMVATPVPTSPPASPPAPISPPSPPALSANRPSAVGGPTPSISSPPPTMPPSQAFQDSESLSEDLPVEQVSGGTDDILGVNTGSWMNPAESIGYEQYSDNEPISSTLMDSDKIQSTSQSIETSYDEIEDESDSIDGFAATSGLKGLTEFMDFDLKRKK